MAPADAPPAAEIARAARFSPCGAHRLLLERHWGDGPLVGFVMLNPSTADAERDDPTIRRCIGFARRWGAGGLLVANLFTVRATDPRELAAAPAADRNAPDADATLREVASRSALLVRAWGAHALATPRAAAVERLLGQGAPSAVLGRTRSGAPRHPLYVHGRTAPLDAWSGARIRLPLAAPGD